MNRSTIAIAALRLLFTSLSILILLAILTLIDLGKSLHKALNNYVDSCEILSAPKALETQPILKQTETITEYQLEPGNQLTTIEPSNRFTIRQLKAIAKEKRIPKYSKLTKAELLSAIAA